MEVEITKVFWFTTFEPFFWPFSSAKKTYFLAKFPLLTTHKVFADRTKLSGFVLQVFLYTVWKILKFSLIWKFSVKTHYCWNYQLGSANFTKVLSKNYKSKIPSFLHCVLDNTKLVSYNLPVPLQSISLYVGGIFQTQNNCHKSYKKFFQSFFQRNFELWTLFLKDSLFVFFALVIDFWLAESKKRALKIQRKVHASRRQTRASKLTKTN